MTSFVLLLLAASDGGTLCGPAPCEAFKTPRAAFEQVVAGSPIVLAIGEYHEVEGAPKVPSALKRFTKELLPALKGQATSLVVETWMTNGKCGQVEKAAVAEVKKVTKRPETTEDELTTLLDASYSQGIANHILVLDCDEYKGMLNDSGGLDAEKSLLLVRRKVEEKALEVREKGEGGFPGKVLLLYGGAIHNDLVPMDDWKQYSYGPSLQKAIDGGYVEVDLIVPEYGKADDDLVKEPWWPAALKLAGTTKTVLVRPNPGVFMLVFPSKKK